MLAVVVQVGGCGRTVAPSAAVVVYSLEPGKLARLLTLSTSYPSAWLTCPLALGRALALTMDGVARGCDRTRLCNFSPSKRLYSWNQLLCIRQREKNKHAKLSKIAEMALSHQHCSSLMNCCVCIERWVY